MLSRHKVDNRVVNKVANKVANKARISAANRADSAVVSKGASRASKADVLGSPARWIQTSANTADNLEPTRIS